MSDTEENWNFAENFSWANTFPKCGAKNQSPININTELTQICKLLCNFKIHYKPSKCYVNYKNNLITIKNSTDSKNKSYLEYDNILYELKEITIHTPTLHSIDNSKFDLEICLIHNLSNDNTSTTNSDSPDGIILCRLFEAGPHYGNAEEFINQIINDFPKESINYDKEIEVSNDWGAEMLLPENKSVFMYDGSLPYPPCNTNYKILVFEDIGTIGRTNLDIFKLNIGENIRLTQQLGDRVVLYKPYYKDEEQNKNRTNGISDNKFLKCVKSPLVDLLPNKTEPIVSKSTENILEEEGISEDTKYILKQIFLLIIVIFIFMNSVVFVKYLFGQFYAQKLLIMLVGKEYLMGYIKKWDTCDRYGNKEKLKI